MYLCRMMTDNSFPAIGEVFGRDHSMVIHAHNLAHRERLGLSLLDREDRTRIDASSSLLISLTRLRKDVTPAYFKNNPGHIAALRAARTLSSS